MNKKAIFITLYLAVACFVGIGTYCLIDSEVQKRQTETTEATTEAYVSEDGLQHGLVDSIDNHVSNNKEEETTEYMADQLAPDFEVYDKDDPDNPQAVVWYTPTTKATTEEPTTAAPAQPPASTPAPETPTTTGAPATTTTEAPATSAPVTETPVVTEAPAPTPDPAPETPATPAPETPAE